VYLTSEHADRQDDANRSLLTSFLDVILVVTIIDVFIRLSLLIGRAATATGYRRRVCRPFLSVLLSLYICALLYSSLRRRSISRCPCRCMTLTEDDCLDLRDEVSAKMSVTPSAAAAVSRASISRSAVQHPVGSSQLNPTL